MNVKCMLNKVFSEVENIYAPLQSKPRVLPVLVKQSIKSVN